MRSVLNVRSKLQSVTLNFIQVCHMHKRQSFSINPSFDVPEPVS